MTRFDAAFAPIAGATGATFSLATTALTDNGAQFQVVVCAAPTRCVTSNPATLTTDQRGTQRIIGASTDIGAVEAFNLVVFNNADAGRLVCIEIIWVRVGVKGGGLVGIETSVHVGIERGQVAYLDVSFAHRTRVVCDRNN